MAIANYSTYKSRRTSAYQTIQLMKSGLGVTALGRLYSLWAATGPTTGVAPTTAANPSQTIAGAWGQFDSSGVQRIAQLTASSASGGLLIVADRLAEQGGLSGLLTTAQTTNLPTAALTRYTDGIGVFASFEVYSALGSSATTVTATYTNDSGSDVTSQATAIGGGNANDAGRSILMPLAQGDRGVKAVKDVTIAVSTGGAGNFGVTLWKPLIAYPLMLFGEPEVFDGVEAMFGQLPKIVNGACLYYQFIPYGGTSQTSVGALQTEHVIIEE